MAIILKKREKLILYVTLGVIILSILFNASIAPALSKNSVLNKEIGLARMRLKKYLVLLSQKEAITKKFSRFKQESNLSGRSVDSLVQTLTQLQEFAKESNISIIDIRPQAAKKLDLYKEILLDLRAEGSLEGYFKFIYEIENSLALLKIKKLQLNAKPNSQELEGIFSVSKLNISD
jgi:hypothetical protein